MMLCRELEILPVEVVVRGYLSGSAWIAYQKDGAVCGVHLPAGLRESDRLPEPILTPVDEGRDRRPRREHHVRGDGRPAGRRSRRADAGRPHPRHRARGCTATAPRSPSGRASSWPTRSSSSAWSPGSGDLVLTDEVLTPDSSRFWDAEVVGAGPRPGVVRQAVRARLAHRPGWDKTAPGPDLPAEVVTGTRDRYVAAFERITGASFARYLKEDVLAR